MFFRVVFTIFLISGCAASKKISIKGNPPGTVQINDTLFVDQTEVQNIHWREYLAYIEQIEKDEEAYKKALPDTTVWIEDSMSNYYFNSYFRHPSTNFYPVVGVSFEQVIEFCKWRTYAANQAGYFRENKIKDFNNHLKDEFPIRYYYRLPTREEWELASLGKLDTSVSNFGGVEERFPNRCCYFNTKGYYDHLNAGKKETKKVAKFRIMGSKFLFPNHYGMFAYIGNVAEMISEKGIAKGGSFIHTLDSCKIMLIQQYSKPERWLGFRCVAVKIY